MDGSVIRENNIELYDILSEKHNSSIFAKRPNGVGEKLLQGKVTFEKLTELEQAKVLTQILQLTQVANLGADLSLIGGAKKSGMMLISKNVPETGEFVLINQSPAGLYETEIDLKTI